MIDIKTDINLLPYNTFGFSTKAKKFILCPDNESIKQALQYIKSSQRPYFILGGGSNVLFSNDFDGVIIHPTLQQISIVKEDNKQIWIEAGAGVEWDYLVEYTVKNNWYGLENLSYIPGNVGASPVQNIGAYGVEVKDCIELVKGYNIDSMEAFEYGNQQCAFAYRQSIFKSELKNKTIITSVVFRLDKEGTFKLDYGPVKEQVEKNGDISLANVRQTIIDIRKSKLPEPEELGNAGSFFKNPIISIEKFKQVKKQHPNIPSYSVDEQNVKIPAGWLIDQAGWKGKSMGDAAVHDKQALVLVNKGNAEGKDILNLANRIIESVKSSYNIGIEPEVNIL